MRGARLIGLRGLVLALMIGLMGAGAALAQTTGARQVDESGALVARPGAVSGVLPANDPAKVATAKTAGAAEVPPIDYAAWERVALRAEKAIANQSVSSSTLDALRPVLVQWRGSMLGAQHANDSRIATLRTQIAALGPAPADGVVEADEIAQRRTALSDQLVQLQAPGLAAEEAYRRADGLISEIDRQVRERQANELLQLWPAPINPGNWPEAVIGATDTGVRIWDEFDENWADPKARETLKDNLPLSVSFIAMAIGLIWFGRGWVERWAMRLQDRASARGRKVWALLASLGEVVFPVIGMILITIAAEMSGMLGPLSTSVVDSLVDLTMPVILASWLAGQVFPRGAAPGPLNLPPERRAEARYNAVAMGLLLGLDWLRSGAMDAQSYSEGTTSVMSFPGLVVSGLLLVRMGQLLHRHVGTPLLKEAEAQNYGTKLIGLLGRGAMAVGLVGPLLAAIGYVPAAAALIYPAVISLALVGLLLILQNLVTVIYAILARVDGEEQDALFPVLMNFALALGMLPFLALIWGARTSDLSELWIKFREGFSIGTTRVSPTSFLVFAGIFALGYMLTRLFQGGLKATILPRTSLDQGGQNAIVSGVGYIGIFLAALIAINAAGIDLSGLAIVAGALSVGIGFGLQAVVSNFVSGIILLIERPVSEGDWIEVGTTQGIVKSISVRSTRIQTFDRSDVIVPNSDLISGRVTNFTRFNNTGRLIVPVGVSFGSDTRKVEKVLFAIAEAQPLVILNPPPQVLLTGFGADAINFEIRAILRDVNFIAVVRSEINHQIVDRFAAEGIEIPFAQTEVTLRNVAEVGAALHEIGQAAPASRRTARKPTAAKLAQDPNA